MPLRRDHLTSALSSKERSISMGRANRAPEFHLFLSLVPCLGLNQNVETNSLLVEDLKTNSQRSAVQSHKSGELPF